MRSKALDPKRLDLAAFAREHARLDGSLGLRALPRVHASRPEGLAPVEGETLDWQAEGTMRKLPDGRIQPWLTLRAGLALTLQCQRCLGPVVAPVAIDRAFRFVPTEAQADAEDLDAEEEVLVLPSRLNLLELLEDEVLLALPLVPRHAVCPEPLPLPRSEPVAEAPLAPQADTERPHPFAALAALKTPKASGSGA